MDKSDTGQARSQATLVASLMRADAYPHSVSSLQSFDTHISWVILTGKFAYKIKKALRLDFLDFSTLELRRHFCEEELRLNSRWAPDLYLEVVPIFGSYENPTLAGSGEAIEYAVKMRQFEQSSQLDKQLKLGLLSDEDMLDLAETIDGYHETADVIEFDTAEAAIGDVSAPMYDNFPPLTAVADSAQLGKVRDWTEQSLARLGSTLVARRKSGYVRECHGDLHLTNLVRLPSGIVPYDCVEFAAELRVMDVLSDISFLIMDLLARGRQDLGYTLINRYLEKSGDYAGMSVFGLYFVYHCMIRAKVAAIRNTRHSLEELGNRLSAALDWIDRPPPVLIAMHGYSGSGKTWASSQLLAQIPAIRIRSDIERKRLHGLSELEASKSPVGQGIYVKSASDAVYARLSGLAAQLLGAGFSVILDASFLEKSHREEARKVAAGEGVAFVIVDVTADEAELERRIKARGNGIEQVSEADPGVLRYQLEHADPLDAAELGRTLSLATDGLPDMRKLVGSIKSLC